MTPEEIEQYRQNWQTRQTPPPPAPAPVPPPPPKETPSDLPNYARPWPPLVPATPAQPPVDRYASGGSEVNNLMREYGAGFMGTMEPIYGTAQSYLHRLAPQTIPVPSQEGIMTPWGTVPHPDVSNLRTDDIDDPITIGLRGAARGMGAQTPLALAAAPFTRGAATLPLMYAGALGGGASALAHRYAPGLEFPAEVGTAIASGGIGAGASVVGRAAQMIGGALHHIPMIGPAIGSVAHLAGAATDTLAKTVLSGFGGILRSASGYWAGSEGAQSAPNPPNALAPR